MLKEGKTYVLPLLLGFLILSAFHICLASYLFQADNSFTTIPPLQRHVNKLQLPKCPQRLTPADPNPFLAAVVEDQEGLATPARQQMLRLAGIITKDEKRFALIEYGGVNRLYSIGDQLGAYRLRAISSQQVILQGEEKEICLAMEKRP